MSQFEMVRAAEYIDPVAHAVAPESVPVRDAVAADLIEKANVGAQLFFMLYTLPKEFWVDDGPAAQLLKRTGFVKAYARAQRAYLRDSA